MERVFWGQKRVGYSDFILFKKIFYYLDIICISPGN